jgi:hypothetical protein
MRCDFFSISAFWEIRTPKPESKPQGLKASAKQALEGFDIIRTIYSVPLWLTSF